MQGIEPKLHTNLTSRIEYYRLLIEAADHSEAHSSDVTTQIAELANLYEEYLKNKKNLEESIKSYRAYHTDLRKKLTVRLREIKRKAREK